ncbi:MAG TPA: GspH/FimT family pseudopilin [Steroidobacteraceae bacterium]
MRPLRSSRAGFTIVELMVTISLAAILLAVAIPSFRQMIASNRLTTQINDFVSAVNFARSEAITRNLNVSFCRVDDPEDDECSTDDGVWRNWIVLGSNGTVMRRGEVTDASGISVSSTLTSDQIVFGANGLSTTGGLLVSDSQITVCSDMATGTNIRQITLGAGSRITTEKLSGAC